MGDLVRLRIENAREIVHGEQLEFCFAVGENERNRAFVDPMHIMSDVRWSSLLSEHKIDYILDTRFDVWLGPTPWCHRNRCDILDKKKIQYLRIDEIFYSFFAKNHIDMECNGTCMREFVSSLKKNKFDFSSISERNILFLFSSPHLNIHKKALLILEELISA